MDSRQVSHSWDTKYFKQIDLYWHNKSIFVQMTKEQGIQQKAILNKLDYLDQKYETIVKVLWGMEVVGQAGPDSRLRGPYRKRSSLHIYGLSL